MNASKRWTPLLLLALSITGCAQTNPGVKTTEANLKRFNQLDFDAYSKQNWALFKEIHCADVVVTMPDGSQTKGIEAHMKSMPWTFAWAPDHSIPSHPTSAADADMTAVTGRFKGTFTKPMPMMDGSAVPPTGKAFDVSMATFARWQNGCIAEEQVFMNEATLMKQIGLAK